MSKNPFVVLGVNENVTQSELYDAYKDLRNKYSDLRFEPGEVGNNACIKLEEIESAYAEANDILRSSFDIGYTGDNLDEADKAIKEDKLDEAQHILDNCQNRTAQWHYLQAAIFYRKNWTADALKQLDYACSMEPNNEKYAETRKTLLTKMTANTTTQDNSFYNGSERNENARSYSQTRQHDQSRRGMSACDCCSTLICADCCCECMGGDLISCC